MRKYFGTDGIRGRVNSKPMTAEIAMRVGLAAGRYFTKGEHRHRVVIGKDTRLSGYIYEPALTAGFVAVGMDVILVGPMPTPAIAMLTHSMRADLGVMISASHNRFEDNGIKLFGPDGYKLSDTVEIEIEKLIDIAFVDDYAKATKTGRATRLDDVWGRYIEFVKSTVNADFSLEGLKIVIDCANGAAYKVAPTVLWELGAEVIPLAVEPNGLNINLNCGSTHPENLCAQVLSSSADIGLALDGDADRLVVCDEKGNLVAGDQLLGLAACAMKQKGKLRKNTIVVSVLSNLGLEKFLKSQGISLIRTPVGDRYVVEAMRENNLSFGGEQSGHMVFSDFTTTGDGLISALQLLDDIKRQDRPASEVFSLFNPLPQMMRNVSANIGDPLNHPHVQEIINLFNTELKNNGRILVRKSGTEPVIRVMAEGEDEKLVRKAVDDICAVIETVT